MYCIPPLTVLTFIALFSVTRTLEIILFVSSRRVTVAYNDVQKNA